jgi:hypothetical protein
MKTPVFELVDVEKIDAKTRANDQNCAGKESPLAIAPLREMKKETNRVLIPELVERGLQHLVHPAVRTTKFVAHRAVQLSRGGDGFFGAT